MAIRTRDLDEMASNVSVSADVRRISAAMVAAINDWPVPNLDSLEVFVSELKKEIGTLSKADIGQKLKDYSPVNDAWKCESLTELLVAWGNDSDDVLLDDLIERITQP